MISAQLPALQVVVPLIAAALCLVLSRPLAAWTLTFLASAAAMVVSFLLLGAVMDSGTIDYAFGGWAAPFGIAYRIDLVNAYVLMIVSTISTVVSVFARASVTSEIEAHNQGFFYTAWLLCLTGLLGIAITGDIFNLYVFMEIAALSSYALIAYGKGRAYMAAFNYLIMGTMGACLYLLGVGFVFVKTGTLNVDDVSALLPALGQSQAVFVGFVLILLGAWAKMAFFPFHGWLPNAYTYAPTASAVVLAPLATKVAVYAMLRIMVTVYSIDYILNSPGIQSVVLGLSSIAIVVASFFSLTQTNLKMIACYMVLSEIGYMVGGAWLANEPGLTGAMYHVVADAAMTSALFMTVGCIVYRLGQAQLNDLKGVFFKMPVTMAAFVVTMAALIGVPPTCGFFSKWYLIQGAAQEGVWHFVVALLLSSLIKAIILFRIVEIGYNRVPHPAVEGNPAIPRDEAPLSMLIPTVAMALGLVALGLATSPLVNTIISKALPAGLAP